MLFKNKLCRILASVVALAALTLTLPQTALAQDRFMKGIWVSTVYNIDYPEKPTTNIEWLMNEADNVLNDCQDLGFNT
ncbi:MAG: hypothetical protein IJI39_10025, partial [Clostridia bacterium]|nr:hypothetical protein [Clostridia bacterium]